MPRPAKSASPPRKRDRDIAAALERWFAAEARDLPWRPRDGAAPAPRNPYHALVSEAMLQQTQVSRVIDKFNAFVRRFPTVRELADSPLDDVLAMWSGLGYYRRARSLHAAAKAIVERFGGEVPADVDELRTLPGIGRYTAGAIASIAFGRATPLVDGNVARVLLRIDAPDGAADADPQSPGVQAELWRRAAQLVAAAGSPGAFNEGLMELGATVCLPQPRSPLCDSCPLALHCLARRRGEQHRIPRSKAAPQRRPLFAASVIVAGPAGELLVEQRPDRGLWAGLWQAPTVERDDRPPAAAELAERLGLASPTPLFSFPFTTTHRDVRFEVWTAPPPASPPTRGEFLPRKRIAELALSNPQRRILLEPPPDDGPRLF